MFLTKKGDDMLYRHPHEIILQIFYSTKESSTWRYPRRKSATSIRFLPASCKDNTLTNPSVEAIWKYVFLSVTMLPGSDYVRQRLSPFQKSSMPAERHRPDAIPSMQQDMEKDHVQNHIPFSLRPASLYDKFP